MVRQKTVMMGLWCQHVRSFMQHLQNKTIKKPKHVAHTKDCTTQLYQSRVSICFASFHYVATRSIKSTYQFLKEGIYFHIVCNICTVHLSNSKTQPWTLPY